MSVFIIAQINIHDRSGYARYEAGFGAIFARFKGVMRSVDEAPQVLEGDWAYTRTVLIEFPSSDEAKRWFDSEQYQALAEHRKTASVGNIVLINSLPD